MMKSLEGSNLPYKDKLIEATREFCEKAREELKKQKTIPITGDYQPSEYDSPEAAAIKEFTAALKNASVNTGANGNSISINLGTDNALILVYPRPGGQNQSVGVGWKITF